MVKNKIAIALMLTLSILASLLLVGCGERTGEVIKGKDYCVDYIDREVAPENAVYVELKVVGYENPIILLLDRSNAMKTVKNFVALVEKGFYNGLTFHRIIENFMIQGGDASHLPAEQQPSKITGEFLANGYYNDLEHKRGVISMARATDPDSASSGFFICDADSPNLDKQYAAFGYVIEGLYTVDAIVRDTRKVADKNNDGRIADKSKQPVIEYIKILDSYEAK